MARLLVTIGTDGRTDWVQLPDGQKLSLGPISVLTFVTSLSSSSRDVRRVLDGVNAQEEVLLAVDDARMWDLLAPRRARWGSADGSFMSLHSASAETPRPSCLGALTNPLYEPRLMNTTLASALRDLDRHVESLDKYAGRVSPKKMAEGVAILVKLAAKVAKAEAKDAEEDAEEDEDTEEEDTEEEAGEEADEEADEDEPAMGKSAALAYDTVRLNQKTASDILATAEATVEKIEKLAAAGRRFNAAKAKADIHAVTSKVAGILQTSELTEKWVATDLQTLTKRVRQINKLFASARV